jgi:hypothetical protein
MTLKKFAAAGALALGVMAVAGPALAHPKPHPHGPFFGGPDVISPTSVDGNGILNNAISLNICGTNLVPIELIPVLSPRTSSRSRTDQSHSLSGRSPLGGLRPSLLCAAIQRDRSDTPLTGMPGQSNYLESSMSHLITQVE